MKCRLNQKEPSTKVRITLYMFLKAVQNHKETRNLEYAGRTRKEDLAQSVSEYPIVLQEQNWENARQKYGFTTNKHR